MSERFPKALRLRTRREFLRVQGSGVKVSTEPLLALVAPNDKGHVRLGITVSSKVGNAVVRSRIRRLLRELFRKRWKTLPQGVDLVLIAKASAAHADFVRFERAFQQLTTRLAGMFP